MKTYVGMSGYSYKEWKGGFYPEKIKAGEMLPYYGSRLGAVEVNNTFYRMPTERLLESWAGQVPEDFVFAFKAPQVITHFKRLTHVEEEAEYLFKTLSFLGKRLGPVLFQFPATFRADVPALERFLRLVPIDMAAAFEFRSPSWHVAPVEDLLRENRCSLAASDSDEAPLSSLVSTAPWGYVRLRRTDYTDGDLLEWAERISGQNWERAFIFFKHEAAGGPEKALRFRDLLSGGGET